MLIFDAAGVYNIGTYTTFICIVPTRIRMAGIYIFVKYFGKCFPDVQWWTPLAALFFFPGIYIGQEERI